MFLWPCSLVSKQNMLFACASPWPRKAVYPWGCELTRNFSLILGSCNLNWQEPATFGLCSKPYLHDSINLGTLFVKHATEML